MIAYIDAHRDRFGVEPICRVLQFAPSTYWSARRRPASARSQRDAELKAEIARVHAENFGVYGAPKVWAQLNREGHTVARCTVERLMHELGLRGVTRGKPRRTTVADTAAQRPRDLVERRFSAPAPNRLWGRGPDLCADLVGVRVRGLRHRRLQPPHRGLAGLKVASQRPGAARPRTGHLGTQPRRPQRRRGGPSQRPRRSISVHPLQRAPRRERRGQLGGIPRDSYDNALAETIIGLYKTELVRNRGPWRGLEDSSSPPWNGSTGSTAAAAPPQRRPRPASRSRGPPLPSTTLRPPG